MNLDLAGKFALVTGGIGPAICEVLAAEGCMVATDYRFEKKAAGRARGVRPDRGFRGLRAGSLHHGGRHFRQWRATYGVK